MTLLNVQYDLKVEPGKNKRSVCIKRTVLCPDIVSKIRLYETYSFSWPQNILLYRIVIRHVLLVNIAQNQVKQNAKSVIKKGK